MEESRIPAGAIQLATGAPENTRAWPCARVARTARAASVSRDIMIGRPKDRTTEQQNDGTTERRKTRLKRETQMAAETARMATDRSDSCESSRHLDRHSLIRKHRDSF